MYGKARDMNEVKHFRHHDYIISINNLLSDFLVQEKVIYKMTKKRKVEKPTLRCDGSN
jgi:hypothetical protein